MVEQSFHHSLLMRSFSALYVVELGQKSSWTTGRMQHGLCIHAVTAAMLARQEAACEFFHDCKPPGL